MDGVGSAGVLTVHRVEPESLEIGYVAEADPYLNLALEEDLFRNCPDNTIRLFFYRNTPAVVFGRNQNPWVECDIDACLRQDIALARRISGGGTVFHDQGNLNYSFSMPRAFYDPQYFVDIAVQALCHLGVPAVSCPRHGIWVGENKVSGTAFMLTGQRALLHGCILVNSDIAQLRHMLKPPERDLQTRCVPSVRASVIRLVDIAPSMTVDALATAISQAAASILNPKTVRRLPPDAAHGAKVAEHRARLLSPAWILGRTGTFIHALKLGSASSFRLTIEHAAVGAVETHGVDGWNDICEGVLVGQDYDGSRLAAALQTAMPPGPERNALTTALQREIPSLQALRLKQIEPPLGLRCPAVSGIPCQEGPVADNGDIG